MKTQWPNSEVDCLVFRSWRTKGCEKNIHIGWAWWKIILFCHFKRISFHYFFLNTLYYLEDNFPRVLYNLNSNMFHVYFMREISGITCGEFTGLDCLLADWGWDVQEVCSQPLSKAWPDLSWELHLACIVGQPACPGMQCCSQRTKMTPSGSSSS